MALTKERKQEIIKEFQLAPGDTGSAEVQVALLSDRIQSLADHFNVHTKDHHSRRGLLKLVGKRRRLLNYLKSNHSSRYRTVIRRLGIRK